MKKYLEYQSIFIDIPSYSMEKVVKETKESYRFALRYKLYQLYDKVSDDMENAFIWIYGSSIHDWPGMLLCLEHELNGCVGCSSAALPRAKELFRKLM